MKTINEKIQKCNRCYLCLLECNKYNLNLGHGKLLGYHRPNFINNRDIIMMVGLNPSYRRFKGITHAFGGEVEHKGTGDKFIKILKELNLLDKLYITNLVKCSTLTNKVSDDVNNCADWIREEVNILNPKKIVCLGKQVYDFMRSVYPDFEVLKIPHPNYCISYKKISEDKYKKLLLNACLKKSSPIQN